MKKKWISMLLAVLCTLAALGGVSSAAASSGDASFALTLNQSNIVKGKTVTVQLTGQNLDDLYSYEVVLAYDSQKVKFLQAESNLAGFPVTQAKSEGKITFGFTKMGNAQGENGNAALSSFAFEALSAGQASIKLESVKTFNSALSRSDTYTGNTVSLAVSEGSGQPTPTPGGGDITGPSHELGTVTVSGDITVLTVSSGKLGLIPVAGNAVVIKLDSIGNTSAKAVDLSQAVLNQLREAKKDVTIHSGDASLLLPHNSLNLGGIADSVRVTITEGGQAAGAGAGLTAVSGPFGISIQAAGQEVKLAKPIEVTLKRSDVGDSRKVGVYAYNKATGKWEYAGGKVSKDQASITFKVKDAANSTYAAFVYNKKFADVTSAHWAQDPVEVLASKHVVDGVNETEFSPEGNVTRAEFAAMAARVLSLPAAAYKGGYRDVEAGAWYADVIAAAVQAAILEGEGEGIIRPLDRITRQEMAVIAVRVFEKMGQAQGNSHPSVGNVSAGAAFTDGSGIAPWAQEAAATAQQIGLINGKPGNLFAPMDNTTRAEATAIFYRLMEKSGGL